MTLLRLTGLIAILLLPVAVSGCQANIPEGPRPYDASTPEIVIAKGEGVTFPTPEHVRLADGRTFRLAHVVGPEAGTAHYDKAMEALDHWAHAPAYVRIGLKRVGMDDQQETLVELRSYYASRLVCGLSTPAEVREAGRLRWWDQTPGLLLNGLYRLESHDAANSLVGMQVRAQDDDRGVWTDPAVLRWALDFARLECLLWFPDRSIPHDQTSVRPLTAARLLLRADPGRYVPFLTDLVIRNPELGVHWRTEIALMLDAAGHREAISHLIRGRDASLGGADRMFARSAYEKHKAGARTN